MANQLRLFTEKVDDRGEGRKEMDIKCPSKSVTVSFKANYQANGAKPEMRWAGEMIAEESRSLRQTAAEGTISVC